MDEANRLDLELTQAAIEMIPKKPITLLTAFCSLACILAEAGGADEPLEYISKEGRVGEDAPEYVVECVDFLIMLRRTRGETE